MLQNTIPATIEPGDLATYLSAVVALAAAVAAWIVARQSIRVSRLDNQLAYFSSLRSWADEIIAANETAIHLCDLEPPQTKDPSFFNRRYELLCKFSGLLDRGRMFFPNLRQGELGGHKESAFQGYRHKILDSVFASYQQVRRMNYESQEGNDERKQELVKIERTFVSEVQAMLNPQEWSKEYILITRSQRKESA